MLRPRDCKRSALARVGPLAGLLAVAGCDTPQAGATATPATASATNVRTLFVAFDTTATCQASLAQGQNWAPLDTNALVAAPLTVHEEQGTSWSTSHPALGASWLEVAAAQPCLVEGWAPDDIPLDPAAPAYLWLGEPGCERLDPVLGSAYDVHDEAYRITAVLPFRVQRGGTPVLVDVVRLRSEDGTRRLTIERADLDRCVHAEPAPPSSSKSRPVALPVSGAFGPAPVVVASERRARTGSPTTVSARLEGASRPVARVFEAGPWTTEARPVIWGDGVPLRLQVRTTVEPSTAASPAAAPAEPAANPARARVLAQLESETLGAAWAALEARYPSEDAAAYLEGAQARARRTEAQLEATTQEHPLPVPQTPVAEQLVIEGLATVDGFTLATRFTVQAWAPTDANGRQRNRALQQQAAARLRRFADVAAVLRQYAEADASAMFVEAAPAAGLTVTATILAEAPVALVHGWSVPQPGPGVIDLPVSVPRGHDCVVFAAESLGPDDTEGLQLDLGVAHAAAFTSLAADRRDTPRPAIRTCGLPLDAELVLRVQSDVPFAVGMFVDGEDVTAGHLVASSGAPLLPLSSNASLDGALGLPDPIDLADSAAQAGRIASTFDKDTP